MSLTQPELSTLSPQPPRETHRWELRGAGLENLSLARGPVPPPGPGELLLRVDACGICFSDIKILNLGGDHPRLTGRDLETEPVVMGHETALTVVAVGDELRSRYAPGERYIIQADVYYGGQNVAFGYRLPGGYSQYQRVGREVLEGDEGSYLLPVSEKVGHAQAALCEPWACVEASYAFQPRPGPRTGGVALSLPNAEPANEGVEARRLFPEGLDDVLADTLPSPEQARELLDQLRPGGAFAVRARASQSCEVAVDVGSVHYRAHWLTRCEQDGGSVSYPWGRSCELTPGGTALFIGAGGPLGQMHLQRALSLAKPPRKLVATQRGGPRFAELQQRFGAMAARRGVEWALLDPLALGDQIYEAALAETRGRGFDDVVTIIPDLETIAAGYRLLAPRGGLNVFAGVPVGSRAPLDLARIVNDDVRLWGTSGSSIADLRRIVARVEADELDTDRIVAAVGGIEAVAEGLAGVRDARFPGKTVIYPQLAGLPLTSVGDLAERHPSLAERLGDGRFWNPDAEGELFRLYGSAP